MKKNKYLIVILILVVVSGCIGLTEEDVKTTKNDEQKLTKDQIEKITEYATENNKPEVCNRLIGVDKSFCINQVKTKARGPNNNIPKLDKEYVWRLEWAEKLEYPQLCYSINSEKNRIACITNLAISENKPAICEYIGEPAKSDCITRIAANNNLAILCNILNPEEQARCILHVAKEKNRAELCSYIKGNKKEECDIYFNNNNKKQ